MRLTVMSVNFNAKTDSNPHNLPPGYSKGKITWLKISLASHFVLKKIIEAILFIKSSEYLHKSHEILNVRILHIDAILVQQKLPTELRKYLVVLTRNLPSLKAYFAGNINKKCKDCFEEFQKKVLKCVTKVDAISEYRSFYLENAHKRINEDIIRLERKIIQAPKASSLTGVCHAMISSIAKRLLVDDEEITSISKHINKYAKGVDDEIGGLQVFLDTHSDSYSSYGWDQLSAIDSILGLASVTIKPNQFDTLKEGVFHMALPVGPGIKHSLLLNISSKSIQLLDPNFGVFEIPNPELKDFLKNLFIHYWSNVRGTKPDADQINKVFSQDKSKIYSEGDLIEIRHLKRAKEHQWNIAYSDKYRYEAVWGSMPARIKNESEVKEVDSSIPDAHIT